MKEDDILHLVISAEQLRPHLASALERTNFTDLGERYEGKVRDVYTQGDRSILIATDRQSAFDINWCTIPLKGQALTQVSAWWFRKVADIMPHHVISVPDPNVMVVKKLEMIRIEIVVRAYLTGSTKTSAWVNYEKGVRNFCGNRLPDGMRKNQQLEGLIITPTTKAEDDELLDPPAIFKLGLATEKQWKEICDKAFQLFKRGQEIAAKRGLILVDTKYEMGYDQSGNLTVADEVHTPDSSRYWVASTYEERFRKGEEPEALDKEFFRLWLRDQGFEYGKPKPLINDDVRLMLASKYIDLYERVTGETFVLPPVGSALERIEGSLKAYLAQGSGSVRKKAAGVRG